MKNTDRQTVMPENKDRVYARARLSAEVTEEYTYHQVIRKDTNTREVDPPEGTCRIGLFYGGNRWVDRKTEADVARQAVARGEVETIRIGFLHVSNIDSIEFLDDGAGRRYGTASETFSAPLDFPARSLDGDFEARRADATWAERCLVYRPESPPIFPLRLEIELTDENRGGWDDLQKETSNLVKNNKELSKSVGAIDENVRPNFRRGLVLNVCPILTLPKSVLEDDSRSIRIEAEIDWPSRTSIRSLRFQEPPYSSECEWSWQYNPITSRLEWSLADVPLRSFASNSNQSDRVVLAPDIGKIVINKPGELYNVSSLSGRISVHIQGFLHSGVQAFVSMKAGNEVDSLEDISKTSYISSFDVNLRDAFVEREVQPYQELHFRGVIPEAARARDIKMALQNNGFEIEHEVGWLEAATRDQKRYYLFLAHQQIGTKRMDLVVLAEGRIYQTKLESQMRGETYTSTETSGEITLKLRSRLPGNDNTLIQRMNELHDSLNRKFSYARNPH